MADDGGVGIRYHDEEKVSFLRKNLAVIIRSIQWSYAIFWSLSRRQTGILEWNEGYYNGDIKTRKTTQPSELDSDQWGLLRSMHLRDLYMSLSAEESNNNNSNNNNSNNSNSNKQQQLARRPSASLSPEDLTNLEWYFLVCMSFTFRHGQCVPGRTLSIGRETWLCNAHYADTKIFSRSLLAKSASIQTIVCCPFMDGVLELGTTELVLENPDLIKQITSSFWDTPKLVGPDHSISSSKRKEEDGLIQIPTSDGNNHLENLNSILDSNIWAENLPNNNIRGEYLRTSSPDQHSSNDLCPNSQGAHDNGGGGGGGGDDGGGDDDDDDDASVEVMEISDEEFDDNVRRVSFKSSDCMLQSDQLGNNNSQKITVESCSNKHHDGARSHSKLISSLDLGDEDSNYRRILSVILSNPCQSININVNPIPPLPFPDHHSSFKAWKKSTGGGSRTHCGSGAPQSLLKKILSFNSNPIISNDEISNSAANNKNILCGCLRSKKLNYNLEFQRQEQQQWNLSKDSHELSDLTVTVIGKDVFIDMFCPWRECLLLDIVDAITNVHLDPHSVQSSIIDGILSLTITSKHLGVVPVFPGIIEEAIRGVFGKC